MPVELPETAVGTRVALFPMTPSPVRPSPPLIPQQYAAQEVVAIQAWPLVPTLILATQAVIPVTSTGVDWFTEVPFPAYAPHQHLAQPLVVSAHELFDPTLTAATHDVSPPASTGAFLPVIVPSESS